MSKNTRPYWFPAKNYGWGWGFPCAWQGWVTFIIFIGGVSILPFVINPSEHLLTFMAATVGAAAILIGVCYAKGEPPRWRWGKSDEK